LHGKDYRHAGPATTTADSYVAAVGVLLIAAGLALHVPQGQAG